MAATSATTVPPDLLNVQSLRRAFGPTMAVADCSFGVRAGSVHAIIGENGSGKSTLVKILSGILKPDQGQILIDGKPMAADGGVVAARRFGISTVFQEVLALPELSVIKNLWIGQHSLWRQHRPLRERQELARTVIDRLLGSDSPNLQAPMKTLGLGVQQSITIARSLLTQPRLLILDEATAALDVETRDRLFSEVRLMTRAGASVLFITHKMDEIAMLADDISVLRDGRLVDTMPAAEATSNRMLLAMSGSTGLTRKPKAERVQNGCVLTLSGICIKKSDTDFDLPIHAGEVLGLASLEGHGADAVAKIIAGIEWPISGTLRTPDGRALTRTADFLRAKVAYVPRDRKTEGIFAGLSITDNFAISTMSDLARFGIVQQGAVNIALTDHANASSIKFSTPDQSIRELSGGNQQKVILARVIATQPSILALNDPTRGVDQKTKSDIYGQLNDLVQKGVAVVIHSTEVDELISVCDRIAVFHDGKLICVLIAAASSKSEIVAAMFGQQP